MVSFVKKAAADAYLTTKAIFSSNYCPHCGQKLKKPDNITKSIPDRSIPSNFGDFCPTPYSAWDIR